MNQTLAGNLLVASARIQDSVQAQSVCLTIHEDHEKVVGVLINRPLHVVPALGLPGGSPLQLPAAIASPPAGSISIPQSQLPSELTDFAALCWGGPMPGPVVAVHSNDEFGESMASEGLYLTADRDAIEALGKTDDDSARVFVGCVGWPIEQIHAEIHAGWWHTVPTHADIVLSDPSDMWPEFDSTSDRQDLGFLDKCA